MAGRTETRWSFSLTRALTGSRASAPPSPGPTRRHASSHGAAASATRSSSGHERLESAQHPKRRPRRDQGRAGPGAGLTVTRDRGRPSGEGVGSGGGVATLCPPVVVVVTVTSFAPARSLCGGTQAARQTPVGDAHAQCSCCGQASERARLQSPRMCVRARLKQCGHMTTAESLNGSCCMERCCVYCFLHCMKYYVAKWGQCSPSVGLSQARRRAPSNIKDWR